MFLMWVYQSNGIFFKETDSLNSPKRYQVWSPSCYGVDDHDDLLIHPRRIGPSFCVSDSPGPLGNPLWMVVDVESIKWWDLPKLGGCPQNRGARVFEIAMLQCRTDSFPSWRYDLVGGLEHVLFSHILGIIIPIDEYFSERCWNHQPVMLMFPTGQPVLGDWVGMCYKPWGAWGWGSPMGRIW